jgi:hypothetical protein
MPLTEPAPRRLIHTREIECRGYEREDGLWDIEAHLRDTKTQVHPRRAGGRARQPGEPVHDMWLRVTIDLDMKIHDVEAKTDEGPYAICGNIAPHFKGLIGITIGAGWRKRIAESVGGVKGCTHLVELLGPLGTTAFQATGRARQARSAGKPITRKPYQLNGCHVYKEDGPIARERWPEYYTGKR